MCILFAFAMQILANSQVRTKGKSTFAHQIELSSTEHAQKPIQMLKTYLKCDPTNTDTSPQINI